jgi:hypothetical protein
MRAGKTRAETPVPKPPGFGELYKAEQVRSCKGFGTKFRKTQAHYLFRKVDCDELRSVSNRYRKEPSRTHSEFEVLNMLAQ